MKACNKLLDVGGGSGGFSMTLAKAFPALHATVLDFPNVCAVGEYLLVWTSKTVVLHGLGLSALHDSAN